MDNSLLSILTFLLGLILGHWLAIGRDKRKEFNAAAEKFHSAFTDTIQLLRGGRHDVFTIITANVIEKQDHAVIEFERFLSKTERALLKKSWLQYSSAPHTRAPGSLNNRKVDIRDALENIESILNSAKPR